MRIAILIKKAEAEGMRVPEDVAFFIAKHIQSDVRELEGALKRVLVYANFSSQPLSPELAREALKDVLAIQFRQVTIENIHMDVLSCTRDILFFVLERKECLCQIKQTK